MVIVALWENGGMKLEDLRVYELAMDLGHRVWCLVAEWDSFAKGTVGRQLVRAADSVAANLSEGFGRFFYKETKQFGYYSRGSLFETKTWLRKAQNRGLLAVEVYTTLMQDIDNIGIRLNNYIKSVGTEAHEVHETPGTYADPVAADWDDLPDVAG